MYHSPVCFLLLLSYVAPPSDKEPLIALNMGNCHWNLTFDLATALAAMDTCHGTQPFQLEARIQELRISWVALEGFWVSDFSLIFYEIYAITIYSIDLESIITLHKNM